MYVHFGWNPVLFFIALVVSFVLVSVLKKAPVAWLLPAFVLYFGLDWEFSSPWSQLFKLVFWLTVIVVLVTAVRPAKTKLAKVPLVIASVIIVLGLFGNANWVDSLGGNIQAAIGQAAPDKKSPKACSDTWAIQKADYGDTRWFADGIVEIEKAKTEAEARAAVGVWLDRVKTDPLLLSSAAKTFLKKDVNQADLVTDSCGSDTAVKTVLDIETEVAKAAVKKVKSAPRGTVTTGVQNGEMVSTPTTGDDAAIRITLKDGTVIWLERDCGNVVTKKPVFPPDNPEKDCPPDMPHGDYPLCKDDPSKDPAQNGNAPEGGGRNEDSGPGTYVPPGDMDRPSDTPRTNPPPPSGGGSGGGSTPTPDPRPAPSPEPEAPKPSDPETGCIVIPGVEDCK